MTISKVSILEVGDRSEEIVESLLVLWEKSVRATHFFLSEENIASIAAYVPHALQEVAHLMIAKNDRMETIAFMGVDENRLEMLFLAPEARGKGVGRLWLEYGIDRFGVDQVCVNEQNPEALKFYEHMGFRVYKRTGLDEQGNPFPVLYMNLAGRE